MSQLNPQQIQVLPQPPPQQLGNQPVLVYPNTVTKQPPSSHHSGGSFATVFIVLTVILVVSVIACLLGRLCNRRLQHQKAKQRKNDQRSDHRFGHKGKDPNLHPKEGDLEFGIDKRNRPNNGTGDAQNGQMIKPGGDNYHGIDGA